MSAPESGFAILKKPAGMARAFDSSPLALDLPEYIRELRMSLPGLRADHYRGIERNPLNPDMDHQDPGWAWSRERVPNDEGPARRRMAEILGIVKGEWCDDLWLNVFPYLVRDLAAVRELFDLILRREEFEIVHVARHPTRSMVPSIGFDVGYWATENFSIVCDSAFWPQWHPPPSDAMSALKRRLEPLNDYGLFPSAEAAAEFREWYRSQAWAEIEDDGETGGFDVIEISLVDPEGSIVGSRRA